MLHVGASSGADSIGYGGASVPFLQMAWQRGGGIVSRRTANKKLIKP